MTSSVGRMSCGDGFQNRDPGHSPAFYNTMHYVLYVGVFVVPPPMAGCTSTYGRPHGGPQQVTQGLGLGRALVPVPDVGIWSLTRRSRKLIAFRSYFGQIAAASISDS